MFTIRIALLLLTLVLRTGAAELIAISNERSGTVSLLRDDDHSLISAIPVGQRPRGIHASPDGKFIYVALSGTPISGPPQLDADGNPIFKREDPANSDHSADAIGIIDVQKRALVRKIPSGSDPEQFAVSADGKRLFISNEDIGMVSIVNVADGRVESTIEVREEPEGVALTPDGAHLYVTCETRGEICIVDSRTTQKIGELLVPGRPRTVAFLPDGSRAYVPSESKGTVHVIDTRTLKTIKVIQLPPGSRPMGTAMTRDGRLFVSNGRAGTVSVIDTKGNEVRATIKVGKRPWGVVLSSDDERLYIANGPSNDISVVDVKTLKEVARIPVGESPWGVTVIPQPLAGASSF
jgi:YVTN family beta-propeller protein